ncbi:3-deoxy-8-phosphooctulonate synthase [Ruficoccus amylovorans]|uniref:2-dehydro-3-deoxyphosphooctonate aldolase n=1 Tax=Ruficoccus amylovorans TaxID=1804625 RepID=A0A842HG21_9BACT|nr:3-deoxy-8-phosphooctulonate synthase [Ruficoccus amylovorans]MBC2595625.1 3-deoxy-8-phosphooctulonate synthase [Ruficoccus amylovorans]
MKLYDPNRLLLIAGPCSLETEDVTFSVADKLAELAAAHPELNVVFKGSFDKANRTSLGSERGPGMEEGLARLRQVKEKTGLPVTTDFHLPEQAAPVGEVCDVLQVPAFLCRQTDLLVAAAQTGRVVNVKKGQFLSPAEMRFVVDKLEGAKAAEIWQTERGSTFGYQNLVVDMRSFSIMKGYGHPTVFDATHSVQLPGAGGGKTTGQREFVPALARAALGAGADGLFFETHPDPSKAISDGPNQIPLEQFAALVESCLRVWSAVRIQA